MRFSDDPELAERQMRALITYLTAFGYIDGQFDDAERDYVKSYVARLVEHRVGQRAEAASAEVRSELVGRHTAHFLALFEEVDAEVQSLFTEAVATGEDIHRFVHARLELRCYEIFGSFDADMQRDLFAATGDLLWADGTAHPAEERFRQGLIDLLHGEIDIDADDIELVSATNAVVLGETPLSPRVDDHPFFARIERHYAKDPKVLAEQAKSDGALMTAVRDSLATMRERGKDRLRGHHDVGDFATSKPFLDRFVHIVPALPDRRYELVVLGDLHGCYSCLKAAVMQADFFGKLEAFRADPTNNPDIKLVLLGDYIDRGQFSYNGVLRAAMQLHLHAPEHVFVLRGNHEYYVEHQGKIHGGVRPAEAIQTLEPFAPPGLFQSLMHLFDEMPQTLVFDRVLFAHAGIPRDSTIADVWQDLSSLNHPKIRFEMLWSDPSEADFIPPLLQDKNARFPFGHRQFRNFMARLGTHTMVRGHEKVENGFKRSIDDGVMLLCTLFSSGGAHNNDLPPRSSYRTVIPKALTVRHEDGHTTLTPWAIDYARYNDPLRNQFFSGPAEIPFLA